MLNVDELKIFLMRRAGFLREFVDRRIHKRHRATIAPEDILQDVFIAAFRKRATFVPLAPNSLDKWLQRIA